MNCSLTWTWNSSCHCINVKQFFFYLIDWRFCSFLVWIHSTWRHFNDFPLNGKGSTIDFNDKPDDPPQCFNNSIQTSNNDTNTNPSNQYEMRRDNLKKVLNPVSCQCQIQLFATIDSHTKIAKHKCDDQIWMTGREILQEITNKQLT